MSSTAASSEVAAGAIDGLEAQVDGLAGVGADVDEALAQAASSSLAAPCSVKTTWSPSSAMTTARRASALLEPLEWAR